jgi:PHD/YefM family antitoxin component YafN of YafNO toxin-antitoxin module
MQLPIIKSITDIRKDAKRIFEEVCRKDEVVLVTKNNNKLSVIISPDFLQSLVEENETLWEELEMTRSRKATQKEKVFPLKDVMSGKV